MMTGGALLFTPKLLQITVPEEPVQEPEPEEPQAEEEEEEEKEKDVGTTLVLRELETGAEQRFENVMGYAFANNGERLAYSVSSEDGSTDGVYVVNLGDGGETAVATGEGEYKTLTFDEEGRQLTFLSNRDDYETDQPAFVLYHWRAGSAEARAVAGTGCGGGDPSRPASAGGAGVGGTEPVG